MALVRIQVRRDPAAAWASTNPVLAAGEPGLETDTGKIKYGDGVRAWNALSYSSGVGLGSTVPPAAGTAAAGASQDAARADHSHAMPTNIQAQTVSATGSATVGGNLTVQGQLVGGTHRHQAAEINDLAAAVFSRIVSSIKAGSNIQATVDSAAQTITLSSATAGSLPLSITLNPVDVVTTNDSASFSAATIGGSAVAEYAWQVTADGGASWSDVPGANGTTLRLTGLTSAQDGNRYRLKASSAAEVVYSSAAILRTAAIAITAQPPDVTASIGGSVRLAVTALAGSQAISYAWQRQPAGNTQWLDISDAVLPVYQFVATAETGAGGDKYRAVATAGGLTATSREATVVVSAQDISFSSQPADTTDAAGAASFTAVVTGGSAPLAFRWQRTGGSSSTWTPSDAMADIADGTSGASGQATALLSLTGQTASQHLRRYRLKVTDAIGRSAFSGEAVLRTLSLAITAQPVDVSAVSGATLASNAFSVTATADGGVTYQWQKSTNNGNTWANISGATSANYGGIAVTVADDGALYRCAVTGDGQTLNTSSASLIVAPPALTISPQPSNVTAAFGEATLAFGFTGGPPGTSSVYWESSVPGGGWVRVPGATSTTLTLTGLTIDSNGTLYRGVVQKGAASAITSTATLSVPGVLIFLQPVDTTVVNGEATFYVDYSSVSCSSPTVQWQVRSSPSGNWLNSPGATSKSFPLVSPTTSWNGYQYRARVVCGDSETFSRAATLTVLTPPVVITTQPADATAALGGASFSFAFSGGDSSTPAIRWERALPGGAFAPIAGAVTSTLTVSGITSTLAGAQYRATVTIGAQSATTRSAVLTVPGALITLQPADATAVQGSASFTIDFSATACQDAGIEWERKPVAGTVWVPVAGGRSKTLSLSLLTEADSNHQYRAGVTCGGATAYTSAATLTVPSYEFFSSQPGDQSVFDGDTVTFSYQGIFQASTYSARWLTRRIGQADWTYYTPPTQSAQSVSFVARSTIHHNTQWQVEIRLPGGSSLYSRVASLSVGKKTSNKTISIAGASSLSGIAYAKGALAAVSSEQTALVRRSVNDGDTWTTHFLPDSRYWDGIVATSTGALLAYSSGESGLCTFDGATPIRVLLPASTGTIARSTDGGQTWTKLSLPFFLGSRARAWHLGRENATLVVFRGDTNFFSASQKRWFDQVGRYSGRDVRNGLLYMAVTFNDGASWSVWIIPEPNPFNYRGGLHVTQAAMSPSGVLVLTTRSYEWVNSDWREGTGLLMFRNVAASWGPPSPASTSTVGVAGPPAVRYGVISGGVVPELYDRLSGGARGGSSAVPIVQGTAVPNHEACSVAWVPGAGFLAVSDRYPVAMISQDGNSWGPIATSRVLGQLPLFVTGKDVWAVDTLLRQQEWLVQGDASTYPDFRNTDMGVIGITDSVNCWTASASAVFLLEGAASFTFIPRFEQNPVLSGTPSAPIDIRVTAQNAALRLDWAAPASAGSSALTGYLVQYSLDFGATWSSDINFDASATSRQIPGLTNGAQYVFRVAAVNATGVGVWSLLSAPVTPSPQPPGAPSGVAATYDFATRLVTVSWSPPARTGGNPVTGYVVRLDNFGSLECARLTNPATSVAISIYDLPRGATRGMQFRVSAIGAAGEGTASALSPLITTGF